MGFRLPFSSAHQAGELNLALLHYSQSRFARCACMTVEKHQKKMGLKITRFFLFSNIEIRRQNFFSTTPTSNIRRTVGADILPNPSSHAESQALQGLNGFNQQENYFELKQDERSSIDARKIRTLGRFRPKITGSISAPATKPSVLFTDRRTAASTRG